MINQRFPHSALALALICAAVVMTCALVAQQSATEAPAAFDTPLVADNPGSRSLSNGISKAPGDTFALDQARFERRRDASTGLGPVFNGASCAECHQNGVVGSPGQITEIRVGHKDVNSNFVNPTVVINEGLNVITGRSIVNDRSVCEQAQEHVPNTENIRALRAVPNILGDGFVEAVDDATLRSIAEGQAGQSGGSIHGEAIEVAILEAPGQVRIGRFGWKDQQPTVLSFAGDAYLNEMGVTNRLRPHDVTPVCKTTTDPEDVPDDMGLADIDHFAQFIRGTKAPPRDAQLAATPAARAGEQLFAVGGCAICHVQSLSTAPAGTAIGGGYVVPDALGSKIIHPFGDFLLHDIGTGDGIVQAGPPDTANKLRTAPLWGLRLKSRFMHDLMSLTIEDAVSRHKGEAAGVTDRFNNLTGYERQEIITFLKSL